MKRPSIVTGILIPILAALLLMPLVSVLVFRVAAEDRAHMRAERQLTALRLRVSSLTDQYFGGQEGEAPVLSFIRASAIEMNKTAGNAKLLLYASGARLVYPNEEEDRENVRALSEAIEGRLASLVSDKKSDAVRVTAGGEAYLLQVSGIPLATDRLEYVVTYCQISQVEAWIDDAGRIVLVVSLGLAAVFAAAVFTVIRGVTRPIQALCAAADRISVRDFSPVEPAFSLREPEKLRVSVNRMASQLEQADTAQKTFFQTVSHELRTPLMSIGGYAQGIERGILPDPKGAARVILSETRRLTGMVNDLLTLSRLDRASEAPALHRTDLTEAANEALERVSGAALQKGVGLACSMERGAYVLSDEGLLGTILDNLLSNAVRHAHAQVTVSADRDPDGAWTLRVADDGDGIAPEDMPRLFERFYKGRGGHFGIGLAIADSAAKQCGAELGAYNAPEGGAVFTVRFAGRAGHG